MSEGNRRPAGPLGPLASHYLGDGEERFPAVGGAIIQGLRRWRRFLLAQSREIIVSPPRAFMQESAFDFRDLLLAEAFDPLAGKLAAHPDFNRTILQGFGQLA